jgi:threonine/homoserine/homoserine lactone efflux protein
MTLHAWLAFVAASMIMLLIPGPTVLMVVGDALANRSRRAWGTVAGVASADATAMSLSLAGAGALLEASAAAFTFMKTVGGLYLIYLGVKSILGARSSAAHPGPLAGASGAGVPGTRRFFACRGGTMLARFSKAYAVTVLNPKSILFFVAFVPQFMSAHASFLAQSGVLLATFTSLSLLNSSMYSLLASLVGGRLAAASAQRRVSYAGGCTLIGAGALTLAIRRS